MFTLPVTVSQHIWSKVIVATVMSIIATVAAVLSIGIIGSGSGLLVGLGDVLAAIWKSFTSDPNTWLLYTSTFINDGVFAGTRTYTKVLDSEGNVVLELSLIHI